MNRFVVVVVPDEIEAYKAMRALEALHDQGSIAVYAMGVVAKAADGHVSERQTKRKGPRAMALGALIGGLIGLIGGPPVAAIGAAGGAVMGGWRDVMNVGVGFDFVEEISKKLQPGECAVIAEVDEEWATPLDSRMEELGGVVLRASRDIHQDERIDEQLQTRRAELAQYRAERAQAREERKAKLDARVAEGKEKLEASSARAAARIDALREEMEDKIELLQNQAANAQADAKATVEKRIAELRRDFDGRLSKLKQAYELTKAALSV